jgi:hypothetical protein
VLFTKFCSGDQIEKNEMAGACSRYWEGERLLVGKPEGKRPLGRPRLMWEVKIKMDLHEVGLWAWTGLIWLRIGTCDGHL